MTDATGPGDLDLVFGALANRHRREMLEQLGRHPDSISHLAAARGLSLPAVHKHITVLEGAGMVVRRKVGRTNVLSLDRGALLRVQAWAGAFHAYWGTGEESLDNYAAFLDDETPATEETE